MGWKRASVHNREMWPHQMRMMTTGLAFAKHLPEGYRLLGFDPGYRFVADNNMPTLDLPEVVVDHLLKELKG